jgi:hypothetical protein
MLSLLLPFFVGEIYLRIFHTRVIILDNELGWKATPNYIYSGFQESIDGFRYYTQVSQNDQGFRIFGDLASNRPKLFVIGDSVTQAIHASDDKTYYAIIGKRLEVEIFAYGISGAGTLQEYMIFDKYFDEISPDIVLWQYCPNDFINNSYNLELKTRENYNGMIRPYLEADKIVYRLPLPYPDIVLFFVQHSQVFRFIVGRIYLLQVNSPDTIEAEIMELGFKHDGFEKSYQTTNRIMAMVKNRADKRPVFAFNCSYAQPFHDAFKKISQNQGIDFIEVDVIAEGQKSGQVVLAGDGGHWNHTGHALAGEIISRYLEEKLPCLKSQETCRLEAQDK